MCDSDIIIFHDLLIFMIYCSAVWNVIDSGAGAASGDLSPALRQSAGLSLQLLI